MEHMLLGIGKVMNLTLALALCHCGTTSIKVTHAAAALGTAFRIATLGLDQSEFVSPWVLVITPLLSVVGLLIFATSVQNTDGEAEGQNAARQVTKGRLDRGNIHNIHHCRPSSSTTIANLMDPLPALFTLAHQATIPLTISLLHQSFQPVSQHTIADSPPTDEIPTLRVLIAASLCIGLAFGHSIAHIFSLSARQGRYGCAWSVQRQEGNGRGESGSVDGRAWNRGGCRRPLTIASGVVFCILTLFPASLWAPHLTGRSDIAAKVLPVVMSVLVGIMLEFLYPLVRSSMAGVVSNGVLLQEEHDLGSAGVVVTFGTAGAVLGLMMVQLAEYLDVPILLRLAAAASCWGMVVSQRALMKSGGMGPASPCYASVIEESEGFGRKEEICAR